MNYISFTLKTLQLFFGINGVLTKEFYPPFFQVSYFRFITLGVKV